MSDDLKKLEHERDYWMRVAAYLASCHAATLSHDGPLRSVSRSRRERLEKIVTLCKEFMVGYDGNAGSSYARSAPEDARKHCESALEFVAEGK